MYSNPKNLTKENLDINSKSRLFQIYKNLKRVSLKSNTYFQAYEELFSGYVGKEIIFAENPDIKIRLLLIKTDKLISPFLSKRANKIDSKVMGMHNKPRI